MTGSVLFIGAGPGAPDLITLRGAKAIGAPTSSSGHEPGPPGHPRARETRREIVDSSQLPMEVSCRCTNEPHGCSDRGAHPLRRPGTVGRRRRTDRTVRPAGTRSGDHPRVSRSARSQPPNTSSSLSRDHPVGDPHPAGRRQDPMPAGSPYGPSPATAPPWRYSCRRHAQESCSRSC